MMLLLFKKITVIDKNNFVVVCKMGERRISNEYSCIYSYIEREMLNFHLSAEKNIRSITSFFI